MEQYELKMQALLEPVVEAEGMELIIVECLRMKTRWLVRLYVDKPGGVGVDDCAAVSDLVGDILDVHDLPPGSYTLEVSSPGLDRPLARDKDFIRYKGEQVRIRTAAPIDGLRHFRGELVDYIDKEEGKVLVVRVGERLHHIPRRSVIKANLEYVSPLMRENRERRRRRAGEDR